MKLNLGTISKDEYKNLKKHIDLIPGSYSFVEPKPKAKVYQEYNKWGGLQTTIECNKNFLEFYFVETLFKV